MLNGMHGSLLERPESFVSLQWKRFAEMSIPKSREKFVLNLVPAKASDYIITKYDEIMEGGKTFMSKD